jgi:hypothetical protein
LYLAYRRDGGENHSPTGRLCHLLTALLLSGATDQARQALAEFARRFPNSSLLVAALQSILDGERNRTLADLRRSRGNPRSPRPPGHPALATLTQSVPHWSPFVVKTGPQLVNAPGLLRAVIFHPAGLPGGSFGFSLQ